MGITLKRKTLRNVGLLLLFFTSFFLSGCTKQRMIYSPPITKTPVPEQPLDKTEIIVIDAGHGGKDPGAISTRFDYEEKHLTLSTAHMVKAYLNSLGYKTVMTRSDDSYIPLSQRAEIANKQEGSLFVSIHYNSSPSESASGIEVFYYKEGDVKRTKASKDLGEQVLERLVQHTGASTRGVKSENFAVIRKTTMPAILIEAGFLTNVEERKKLQDPHYRRFIAWGIARGIDQYCASLRN